MLTTLLSLYWTAEETIELREAQMQMWLEDLEEFDLDIIRGALIEWRRTPNQRRPAPGDIRAMCAEHQGSRNAVRMLRGPEKVVNWAEDIWHGGPAERAEALEAQEERYRRAAAYREGKLDEYDAIHHPDRFAQRRRLSDAAE